MTTTLQTHDLRVRWPAQDHWALDGITLTILPGEVTWLHGALGAGSSTLLLALAGLLPRLTGGTREGGVRLASEDPAEHSPLDLGIGYLGPSPALQLSGIARTVRDEIAVGPMNLGWERGRIHTAVDDVMRRVGVEALAARHPDRLSGGETQRVLLAAMLATAPRVLLLDDPFSALDQMSRAEMAMLLRDLATTGLTVVVACDDADTMVDHADRLVVLAHGTIALDDTPTRLLAGEALRSVGASTTDAAALAALAGFPAPRPLTIEALVADIGPLGTISSPRAVPDRVTEAPPPVLACEKVTFGYADHRAVLQDATFSLPNGSATAILGPNGAGKSTLLRLAMALEHPARGVVQTLGRPTQGVGPEDLAPTVGFLFQQPERQLFATSVRAECALGPTLAGWDPDRTARAVTSTLAALGLTPVAGEHPWDLPLPLRRLVALASVLTTSPRLLLLDEPTAGLDAHSRDLVIEVVRGVHAAGATVLAVTHDPIFAHEALETGVLVGGGTIGPLAPLAEVAEEAGVARTAAREVGARLGRHPAASRRDAVAATLRGLRRDRL